MKSVVSLGLMLVPAASAANEPPPHLYDSGGTVCIKLAENGAVADAFMGTSTGSKRKDRDFLAWAKQMRWSQGGQHGVWFSMSLMSKMPNTPPTKPDCDALATKR